MKKHKGLFSAFLLPAAFAAILAGACESGGGGGEGSKAYFPDANAPSNWTPESDANSNVPAFTVDYDAVYGQRPARVSAAVLTDLPLPSAEGRTFLGWYDGDTLVTPPYTVTKNVVLKAKWKKAEYTVSFDSGGHGRAPAAVKAEHGKEISLEDMPDEGGRYFLGWYEEGALAPSRYTVTKDVTLKAYWTSDSVQVSYDAGAYGTDPAERRVAIGRALTAEMLSPPPLKDENAEQAFKGWYNGETKVSAGHTVYADCHLAAKWFDYSGKFVFDEQKAEDGSVSYVLKSVNDKSITEAYIPALHKGLPVTEIGEGAFGHYYTPSKACRSLAYVSIGSSVVKINRNAFHFCDTLERVEFPDSLTEIGNSAFNRCDKLEGITLPDSVTIIGDSAFNLCTGLKSVKAGAALKTIGDSAFNGCTALASADMEAVSEIKKSAFSGCTALVRVKLGSFAETIGEQAFYGCGKLESVSLPSSLKTLGAGAFEGCTGLKSADISLCELADIKSSTFRGCSGLAKITLPDSAAAIGDNAFSGCSGLEAVETGRSLESIGSSAFLNCSSLVSLKLPDSMMTIDKQAFKDCTGLREVSFGNSLEEIGESAFEYCKALSALSFPDSLQSIGANAFSRCSGLSGETVIPAEADVGAGAFGDCPHLRVLQNGVKLK